MGRFFNMDNKFFVFMGKIADLCMLNLLCIISVSYTHLDVYKRQVRSRYL